MLSKTFAICQFLLVFSTCSINAQYVINANIINEDIDFKRFKYELISKSCFESGRVDSTGNFQIDIKKEYLDSIFYLKVQQDNFVDPGNDSECQPLVYYLPFHSEIRRSEFKGGIVSLDIYFTKAKVNHKIPCFYFNVNTFIIDNIDGDVKCFIRVINEGGVMKTVELIGCASRNEIRYKKLARRRVKYVQAVLLEQGAMKNKLKISYKYLDNEINDQYRSVQIKAIEIR